MVDTQSDAVLFHYCGILRRQKISVVFDMCVWRMKTSDNSLSLSLMAKKMDVFDMSMSICVHVRSRFTTLLNSGWEVSKQ